MELETWPQILETPRQLDACLMELKEYSEALQRAEIRSKVSRSRTTHSTDTLSQESRALLRHFGGTKLTRAQVEELIETLAGAKSKLPVVHLTLPAPVQGQARKALVSWFRQLAPLALIDFQTDREIAGGVMVRAGSRIFDYSFRKRLLEHSGVIKETLRHV